jgi:hypothetical protein
MHFINKNRWRKIKRMETELQALNNRGLSAAQLLKLKVAVYDRNKHLLIKYSGYTQGELIRRARECIGKRNAYKKK